MLAGALFLTACSHNSSLPPFTASGFAEDQGAVRIWRKDSGDNVHLLAVFSPWRSGDTTTREYRWQGDNLTLININVYSKPPVNIRARFDDRGDLSFMQREFNNPKIIVVVGAPGDKGVSRRPGFSESLTAYANKAFLTTDDPGFEDPMDIAQEIDAGIDHEKVDVTIELDREKAVHDAIAMSNKDDIVLICGKGADPFQKIRGVDTPYPTDIKVAESVINELEKDDEE